MNVNTLIYAITIFSFIVGCSHKKDYPIQIPDRLSSIPIDATWVGGEDGGSWFLVQSIIGKDVCMEIYDDRTGELLTNGCFTISCDIVLTKKQLIQEIIAYDGEKVIISIETEDGQNCTLLK